MEAQKYNKLSNLCSKIGTSKNVSASIFECTTNLIRVVALSDDVTIKSSKYGFQGDGLVLPEGIIEYFEVTKGEKLDITGSVNITCL